MNIQDNYRIRGLSVSILFIFLSVFSYGQFRIVNSISNSSASNSSAFIDASSNFSLNNTTNIGKGLIFPRTDLTAFTTISPNQGGISSNYPSRYDGMVVYNTATGTSAIGSVSVTPGFYYYENPGNHTPAGNNNGGTWVRLTDGNDPSGGGGVETADIYYGMLGSGTVAVADTAGLTEAAGVTNGEYLARADMTIAAGDDDKHYTVLLPVGWRAPTFLIGSTPTMETLVPANTLDIAGVKYMAWKTHIGIPENKALAIK